MRVVERIQSLRSEIGYTFRIQGRAEFGLVNVIDSVWTCKWP